MAFPWNKCWINLCRLCSTKFYPRQRKNSLQPLGTVFTALNFMSSKFKLMTSVTENVTVRILVTYLCHLQRSVARTVSSRVTDDFQHKHSSISKFKLSSWCMWGFRSSGILRSVKLPTYTAQHSCKRKLCLQQRSPNALSNGSTWCSQWGPNWIITHNDSTGTAPRPGHPVPAATMSSMPRDRRQTHLRVPTLSSAPFLGSGVTEKFTNLVTSPPPPQDRPTVSRNALLDYPKSLIQFRLKKKIFYVEFTSPATIKRNYVFT
jgi:hypothetical protein